MARPLRIEFPGALYHATSRGDRRAPIFADNLDRNALLGMDAVLLADCLTGNHHHLAVHTRRANLSLLMRHVNGVCTQRFNRRHGLAGQLFQGRLKAILVDSDLLRVCRHGDLNPVRAASGAAGIAGAQRHHLAGLAADLPPTRPGVLDGLPPRRPHDDGHRPGSRRLGPAGQPAGGTLGTPDGQRNPGEEVKVET